MVCPLKFPKFQFSNFHFWSPPLQSQWTRFHLTPTKIKLMNLHFHRWRTSTCWKPHIICFEVFHLSSIFFWFPLLIQLSETRWNPESILAFIRSIIERKRTRKISKSKRETTPSFIFFKKKLEKMVTPSIYQNRSTTTSRGCGCCCCCCCHLSLKKRKIMRENVSMNDQKNY